MSEDKSIGKGENAHRAGLLSHLLEDTQDPTLEQKLEWLSVPHWIDGRISLSLADIPEAPSQQFIESLAADGLLECWNDGCLAVPSAVRHLVLSRMVKEKPNAYARLSKVYAELFASATSDSGDAFDYVEHIYHKLGANADACADLLLQAGVGLLSEPLYQFDAVERLTRYGRELGDLVLLPPEVADIFRFMGIYSRGVNGLLLSDLDVIEEILSREPKSQLFRAELFLTLGWINIQSASVERAGALFQRAREQFEALKVLRGEADSIRGLACAAISSGLLVVAEANARLASKIYHELGLHNSASHCIRLLAGVARGRGRLFEAETLFDQALEAFLTHSGHMSGARTRLTYSEVLASRGKFKVAHQHIDRASRAFEKVGDEAGVAECRKSRGVVLFEEGRYLEAREAFSDALQHLDASRSGATSAACQLWLAACEIRLDRSTVAVALLEDALTYFNRVGDRAGQASALRELGLAALRDGSTHTAIEKLEQSAAEFKAIGNEVEASVSSIALARAVITAQFPTPYTVPEITALANSTLLVFEREGLSGGIEEASELAKEVEQLSSSSGGTSGLRKAVESRSFQFRVGPQIPRIEVADYIELGRLVAQWTTEPATRPRDVGELKEQLDGIAVVPDRIKSVKFVESRIDHLVLRLPVKEMLEESLEEMTDPMGDGRYKLPQFYADHYRPGFGPAMTPLDTLLARIGDYTIGQCR
jgi:tetratricopeptide (TPR) repeat protein